MNYAHPLIMRARRLGQSLGILRPLQRAFRRVLKSEYEEEFDRELLASIRLGDCVWDVGANAGIYSIKAAELVGSGGSVIAFEPSPQSIPVLQQATKHLTQVHLIPVALADHDGEGSFTTGEQSVTDSLAKGGDIGGHTVRVSRADAFLESHPPNIVKIDVEGFEPEVLRGMEQTLACPSLRGIFVEVHFLELNKRAQPRAPLEIFNLLRRAGFRVRWLDPSHLAATR